MQQQRIPKKPASFNVQVNTFQMCHLSSNNLSQFFLFSSIFFKIWVKTVSSSSKHDRTMLRFTKYFRFSICLGAVLVLCLLYFTNLMNNSSSPLSAVGYLNEVSGHPFGYGINKLNNNNKFNSSIKTVKGQDNSRNHIYKSSPQAEKSVISRRLQDFRHEWLRQRRARVDWKNRELKQEDFSRRRRGEIREGPGLSSSFSSQI